MKTIPYQEALDAYVNPMQEYVVEPVSGGLINHSYRVTSKLNGESFLLQQINKHVFREPASLQHNYEILWQYLKAEGFPFFIPAPRYFPGDTTLYFDSHGLYWRVFEFIPESQTIPVVGLPEQANAVARCFAGLTGSFEDFDIRRLNITLPGFHNLSLRFKQLQQAIHKGNFQRLQKASIVLTELRKRERYAHLYDIMTESDQFVQRVMHHDAKVSNILFDKETGAVTCPVDFDTVMPGYFFSDLGDMIRSMACSKDENSTDLDSLTIRKDFYEAIVEGYLSVMGKQFTEAEKKYIHHAGLLMTYMQALRFCADYLNGDPYYRIDYGEQNFDRALNQLTLLQRLEDFLHINNLFYSENAG